MEEKSTETKTITPQSLISEDNVKKALLADKGSNAHLKTWKVVDFVKRGDNYACVVTSVEVHYLHNNQEFDVTYVVKLNPLRKFEGFPDLTGYVFEKEGRFYQEVVPDLNAQLASTGQDPLRFPKCFLVDVEEGKEQIYFEDLRPRGFKMSDRKKGLDADHASLVLAELARLHGSSYLLDKKFPNESQETKHDFLEKNIFTYNSEVKKMMIPALNHNIDQGKSMLEKIGGYTTSIDWLESLKSETETLMTSGMKSERFNVISHGDCWNNNILFRYDGEGQPIEVMLLDLQVCRKASLAVDLNYFLYTSVPGEIRTRNMGHYMSTYYSSYKAVVEGGNQAMYFNEEELTKEFRDKNKLGVIFAMSIIPAMLFEADEVPDMSGEIDIQQLMAEFRSKAVAKLDTNPLLKPRFLSVFDELMETGLIS